MSLEGSGSRTLQVFRELVLHFNVEESLDKTVNRVWRDWSWGLLKTYICMNVQIDA